MEPDQNLLDPDQNLLDQMKENEEYSHYHWVYLEDQEELMLQYLTAKLERERLTLTSLFDTIKHALTYTGYVADDEEQARWIRIITAKRVVLDA